MARPEVLRGTESQCLRLGGRVRVAEIKLNAQPGSPKAQKRFDKQAR